MQLHSLYYAFKISLFTHFKIAIIVETFFKEPWEILFQYIPNGNFTGVIRLGLSFLLLLLWHLFDFVVYLHICVMSIGEYPNSKLFHISNRLVT